MCSRSASYADMSSSLASSMAQSAVSLSTMVPTARLLGDEGVEPGGLLLP